jgi:hypothetical protein
MKSIILAGLLLVGMAGFAEAGTKRVRGTVTKSGVYRQPHYRTAPNKTKLDNWSTQGNTNPHTGKKGTKKPY